MLGQQRQVPDLPEAGDTDDGTSVGCQNGLDHRDLWGSCRFTPDEQLLRWKGLTAVLLIIVSLTR